MRIIYWATSCLEWRIEAVSKEIFSLAHHFGKSFIFGISPHYLFKFSMSNRYIGFDGRFDPILRLIIPLVEKSADINHVYGEMSPWLFHKTLFSKPIVLTITLGKGRPISGFMERCRAIVVQTKDVQKRLQDFGIEGQKIHLVYPGVDLGKFRPADKPPQGNIRILFASAPRSQEELEARGVNFLIDAAKMLPDISFSFLFRKWQTGYTSLEATRALVKESGLTNISLSDAIVDDMVAVYHAHHFTVIPFTKSDGGKECPGSLIESLACGVPVLISNVSPFAEFVEENDCGLVFQLGGDGMAKAVEKGCIGYNVLRQRARKAAEKHFCQAEMFRFYAGLYDCLRKNNVH